MNTFKVLLQRIIGIVYTFFLCFLMALTVPLLKSVYEGNQYKVMKATFYKMDYRSSSSKGGKGTRHYFLNGFMNTKFNNRIEIEITEDEFQKYVPLMGDPSATDDTGEYVRQKRITQNVWYDSDNGQATNILESNNILDSVAFKFILYPLILLISLCFLYIIILYVDSNQTLFSLFKESFRYKILSKIAIYFFTFIAFFGCANNMTESSLNTKSLDEMIEVKAQITQISKLTEDSQHDNYSYTIKGINLSDSKIFNYTLKNNQAIYFMFKGVYPFDYRHDDEPSISKFYNQTQKIYCRFWYNPVTQKVFMSQIKPTISSLQSDWMTKFDTAFFILGSLIILSDLIWLIYQYRKGQINTLNP